MIINLFISSFSSALTLKKQTTVYYSRIVILYLCIVILTLFHIDIIIIFTSYLIKTSLNIYQYIVCEIYIDWIINLTEWISFIIVCHKIMLLVNDILKTNNIYNLNNLIIYIKNIKIVTRLEIVNKYLNSIINIRNKLVRIFWVINSYIFFYYTTLTTYYVIYFYILFIFRIRN